MNITLGKFCNSLLGHFICYSLKSLAVDAETALAYWIVTTGLAAWLQDVCQLPVKRAAAAARVACPQRATSFSGVCHVSLNSLQKLLISNI